jgi:hypothetical protein
MKNSLFFFILLLLISCGQKKEKNSCDTMLCEVQAFNLSTTDTGPVPPEALLFNTNLSFVNFASTDIEKAQHAADLVKRVIHTQEFKDAIIGFTYNGENTFANNNGLTNLQIYDRIIIAAEALTPAHNYVLDAELMLY